MLVKMIDTYWLSITISAIPDKNMNSRFAHRVGHGRPLGLADETPKASVFHCLQPATWDSVG